ncbi:MAG: CDP-alcohol phosphatidyltransferase family protein [Alphaproteobacteria bacterium]|nr:MAG: CDP-alcohol phosphatidyltransferase family protein [Alphaproteobacteria bacterium]
MIGVYTFEQQQYAISFLALIVGTASDYFDGKLARYLRVQSRFGKWLDHSADRFSLLCMAYAFYAVFPISVLFLSIPGFFISAIHILFALRFKREMRTRWPEKIWLFIATFLFPALLLIESDDNVNLIYLDILAVIVGVVSSLIGLVQYIRKYHRRRKT